MAAKLGVNPTSLYNHVPNLAAMIEDVRSLVSARIDFYGTAIQAPCSRSTYQPTCAGMLPNHTISQST